MFLKVGKNVFFNLIVLFFVLTASVKFYLTLLSAETCLRFTYIPVCMLSNSPILKLRINLMTFCTQDADGKEMK